VRSLPGSAHGAPHARPENVVAGPHYRISVLDAGLLRLEYSESGTFEDRASQTVINRAFPPSEFTVLESDELVEIHTERCHLVYDKQPFRAEGLSVQAKHSVQGWGGGDFEGFVVADAHDRHVVLVSSEERIETLARRAWRQRLRVQVNRLPDGGVAGMSIAGHPDDED